MRIKVLKVVFIARATSQWLEQLLPIVGTNLSAPI
jgi:hypothetical protein